MPDEYEFFQGAVLRQLIVDSEREVVIRPFVREGRISAFVINASVGFLIKHSAKRMSPWTFTFTLEQISDLLDLEQAYFDSFVVLVCGSDGMVALDVGTLHQIVTFEDRRNAWIRIRRPKRSQYEITGNREAATKKYSTGVLPLLDALNMRTLKAVHA